MMTYKIVTKDEMHCFVIEYVHDNIISETQFAVNSVGDLSLLINALKICEDKLYNNKYKECINDQSK